VNSSASSSSSTTLSGSSFKSLPLGPAPDGSAFHPRDVEGAAEAYPDINFSIVHGGMAFTEETAWLVARFPNIWINLESLNIVLMLRPRAFAEMIAGIMSIASEGAIDRMYWASGAMNCHPRDGLEAFMTFQFPDELRERVGTFFPIPQLTDEHRRKILGENLARLHGFDIAALAEGSRTTSSRARRTPSFPIRTLRRAWPSPS
jgi:predicted TIM-barrel fold metal-dependent hydrolase